MSPSAPRTLADQLRSWSDEQLTALLAARPDLGIPAPQDTSQLASRAGSRASVLRAADGLDLLQLAVLDAFVVCDGSAPLARVVDLVHAAPSSVEAAVRHLQTLALVWGTDQQLRVLSAVPEAVGTSVSGLGSPFAQLASEYGPGRIAEIVQHLELTATGDRAADLELVSAHLSDPEATTKLRTRMPPQAVEILDHLERNNTEGTVGASEATVAPLLDVGLLVARERGKVAVPREVGIALRAGRTTTVSVDTPPAVAVTERPASMADHAAAGAAFETVRHVELLLETWSTRPPPALRGGGLGVRELKAAAVLMHVDERTTALLVETAFAAGLLAVGHTDVLDAAWLPTEDFDHWMALEVGDRWTRLALAWLDNPRLTGTIGGLGDGRVNALAPDLERSWLASTRRETLTELGALPPGHALAAGTGVATLVERLRWLRPRRPAARTEAIAWVVEEASALGVVGLGALSTQGRGLLVDDPTHHAAAALQPLLPDPVDHVMVQADLTAVAPGPLEQGLARDLALMADVESRGGATVYRFTEGSVRRAFDAGWSLSEVHAFLASSSRTDIPQPLTYLVDDVSRRFGTVRVGAAESFLRSDDEVALAELVHHPKAGALRLRRIAPTVVVSDVSLDVLLPRLRELGVAPVVEAPDGTVRVARREVHRARVTPSRSRAPQAAKASARAAATVNALRAGDRAAASRPAQANQARRTTPTSALAALREAAESGASVWVEYVDNDGSTMERVVDPVRVDGGWLTAYDHRTEGKRSFAVHRITGVKELDD